MTTPTGGIDVVFGTAADGSPDRNPDVATFADGQSLIVWQRDISAFGDHDINARVLKADGTGFTTN